MLCIWRLFSFMTDRMDARAWRNCYSYLSIIAHMSRLIFSKAPTVPFSTACKSAAWSSTKIACMQPWKVRWEGGNSVWRKYPKTRKRKNTISNPREFKINRLNAEQRWGDRNKADQSEMGWKGAGVRQQTKKGDSFYLWFKANDEKGTVCGDIELNDDIILD